MIDSLVLEERWLIVTVVCDNDIDGVATLGTSEGMQGLAVPWHVLEGNRIADLLLGGHSGAAELSSVVEHSGRKLFLLLCIKRVSNMIELSGAIRYKDSKFFIN